ncbi:MAG: hypothetical protein ACYS72_02290 [Planctomycetota bacterium]|jgi:hypothetical protein
MSETLTIEDYLKSLEPFIDDAYGQQIRKQFQSMDGKSELAMLQSPTQDEYQQLARAVAIMTATEKETAASLTNEQIERIAEDAKVDKAVLTIFINGFALKNKSVERKRHD